MDHKKKSEMTFLEHLEELRWNILRALLAVGIAAVVAFFFKHIIFDFILLAPREPSFFTNNFLCRLSLRYDMPSLCINKQTFQLVNLSMAGQFSMHLWTSFFAGIVLAFPFIISEFWRFVSPALLQNEKKYARIAVFYSSALFLTGILFGYYIIAPLTIHFLGSYEVSQQITNQINMTSYMYTLISVCIASGVVFELPVIVYFLSKIGLMTPSFMKKYRRHAIIVMLILAAIITPPDIFSQLLVMIPLILLYELSIIISKRVISQK